MTGPLDFNHREKPARFADQVNARVDATLTQDNVAQALRACLGGSRLGESCSRLLQYEFLQGLRDPSVSANPDQFECAWRQRCWA